jgi:hypothetical protein
MKLFNKSPLLTKETIRTTKEQFEYSHQKIVEAIDYQFIPFEESVEETVREFVKNQSEGQSFGFLNV